MTQNDEKYQQQILFDEPKVQGNDNHLTEEVTQIVVEEENFELIEQPEELLDEEPILLKRNKPSRWLLKSSLALLLILVIIEVTQFFIAGFSSQPIIAALYGALLAAIIAMCTRTLYKEIKGLRALKKRTSVRNSFNEINHKGAEKPIREICDSLAQSIPCDSKEGSASRWSDNIPEEMTEKEVLALFNKQVITPADQKVLDKISKFSTEAVVLVSLSPIAIVDMGLMFWRNIKMIDEITNLYGLQIGYWSRIKLIKQVFVNMVYAGASELIADVGADLVGADLLGKLSARLAQGLGAGMLTARLGLQTMKLCRPIAFEPKNAPKLKTIRKQIVSKILSLTKKS
ncbi:YcjF family protein [Thalassotalea sediminis]|uniref:YcjF family protein n=1 Tax=Thalassotalea sediminis TaxID=1759089 RepID=UPI0025742871|nr:TIGR01620 family protein [Thalassotalea sediminis]